MNAFDNEDLRLFNAIAAELAVALENAQLFEREHRFANQQQALLNVFTELISGKLEPEILFQRIVERVIEVIPNADAGSLIVPKNEMFVYAAAAGYDIELLKDFTFFRKAFIENQPQLQEVDFLSHQELLDLSKKYFPTNIEQFIKAVRLNEIKQTLQATLYIGDEVLGSIAVNSFSATNAFTDEDGQTLLLFANPAIIAIQNARRFMQLTKSE